MDENRPAGAIFLNFRWDENSQAGHKYSSWNISVPINNRIDCRTGFHQWHLLRNPIPAIPLRRLIIAMQSNRMAPIVQLNLAYL